MCKCVFNFHPDNDSLSFSENLCLFWRLFSCFKFERHEIFKALNYKEMKQKKNIRKKI